MAQVQFYTIDFGEWRTTVHTRQDMWNSHCGSFSCSCVSVCFIDRINQSTNATKAELFESIFTLYTSGGAGATELDPYKPVKSANRPTDSLLNLVSATTYEWSCSCVCVCVRLCKSAISMIY